MSATYNLIHILELFPLLLAIILGIIALKNKSNIGFGTFYAILFFSIFFIALQLSWWAAHFFLNVEKMPVEFHVGWVVYDTFSIMLLIHLIKGGD